MEGISVHKDDYYKNQAGNGMTFYRGHRYQRGRGWFGRLYSGAVLPLLRYLGKKALSTGVDVVRDVVGGQNFKTSVKSRTRKAAVDAVNDGFDKLQSGKGIKRKRPATKKTSSKKTTDCPKKIKIAKKTCVQPKKTPIKRQPRNSKYDFLK